MNRLVVAVAQSLVVVVFSAAPSLADDDETLKKDLTAVIALHGLPCGQVVAATQLAESDYAATCKDGNKYRVYVNAAGRVVVEAQK
jgi:hypothetical protein